jgi:hypothetical protein
VPSFFVTASTNSARLPYLEITGGVFGTEPDAGGFSACVGLGSGAPARRNASPFSTYPFLGALGAAAISRSVSGTARLTTLPPTSWVSARAPSASISV